MVEVPSSDIQGTVEQRLRQFIEHAADGFYVHDVEGRILDVNQTACAMLGYSKEELLNLRVMDLECLKPADSLIRVWEHLIPNEPILWDGIHKDKTGQLLAIEGYSQRIRKNGDDLIYAFVRNVTERQRVDQLLETIVRVTARTTGDDFLELLTKSLAAALGVQYAFISEVVDDSLSRVRLRVLWNGSGFSEPFEYDVHGTPCEHVFAYGLSWYGNGVAARFPEDRWLQQHNIVSYQAIPFYDAAARPLGHIGVMHVRPIADGPFTEALLRLFACRAGQEIERIHLTTEISIRERQLAALLDASRSLNSALDSGEIMRALVGGAMTMTGARAGAWGRMDEGKLVFKEYLTVDGPQCIDYVFEPGQGVPGQVLLSGQPYLTNDASNDPNVVQTVRHALKFDALINVPIRKRTDQIIGCIELHDKKNGKFDEQDTTFLIALASDAAVALENASLLEKVRAHASELEHRVAQRTAELEQVNADMKSFAYSVSHDLRAPLIAIEGFSNALLEDYQEILDGTGVDYLRRISRASRRMAQLIEDILRLSRISHRKMRRTEVDLSGMAEEIIEDLRSTNPERHVEATIEPGVRAIADGPLIRIALDNLLSNAWKYTRGRDPTKIQFGIEGTGDEAAYFVRDNGVGYDAQYGDKLFQPFQRLHRESEFEGTGIGLAITARVIRRHNGQIWAMSELEQGTTVYFTLGKLAEAES